MKKAILLFLTFSVVLISPGTLLSFAAEASQPRIAIDYAPAIEEGRTVDGHVWFEGSAGKYSDYAITMALEVTRGGTIWGPKPTYATPSVGLNDEGRFSCLFVTGGYDLYAERLYVYLVPANFTPDGDISRTEAAALDKVIIDRYDDGRVEIQQTKKPKPEVPEPAVVFEQQKHPAKTPKLSICYSPYTNGLSPETNSAVPMEQMRWQLNLIYPYADTIRLFGVSGELEKIYKPAKDEYKMRIIAGCWIDGRYPESQIYAELNKLVELANSGYVDVAVVGSETIYRNDFEIVFFSEIDEAWKIEGKNGDIGGHWGHFTSVGMLKDAYLPTYKTISPTPVLDAETVQWAKEAILDLVRLGVIDASGPSLYEPLMPITRGDFIHYIVKALDLEKTAGRTGATFTDVDPNIYYYFTMGSGQKAGLVHGVGGDMCLPDADITRQDMFTLIYRALTYAGMNLPPDAGALDKFGDKDKIADYAKDAISALAKNGLIMGDQNGNVNPLGKASRAEAAVMMYRVYKYANGIQ